MLLALFATCRGAGFGEFVDRAVGSPGFATPHLESSEKLETGFLRLFDVPDQTYSPCPVATTGLRSVTRPQPIRTKIQFHNAAEEAVHIYWLTKTGEEKFRGTIPSGSYRAQVTTEGHAFRIWNHDHSIIMLDFVAGRIPLGSSPKSDKETARELRRTKDDSFLSTMSDLDWNTCFLWRSPRTRRSTVVQSSARIQGFVNRAETVVDLYFVLEHGRNAGDEKRVATILPGDFHYEVTYHMHTFRAREHYSGRLVTQVGMYDIEIPNCLRRRPRDVCPQEKIEQAENEETRESEDESCVLDESCEHNSTGSKGLSVPSAKGVFSAMDGLESSRSGAF